MKSHIHDPRKKLTVHEPLADPRDEPHRDLLAVHRRVLRGKVAAPLAGSAVLATELSTEFAEASGLREAHYRYTKNPPVANDTFGYGEEIREVFWSRDVGGNAAQQAKPKLVAHVRVSRRTRTGRQVLPEQSGLTKDQAAAAARSDADIAPPKAEAKPKAKKKKQTAQA